MSKKSIQSAPVPSKSESDYQAEDDLRTMTRAEEVRADPHRMRRVHRAHKKQVRALKRVGSAIGRRSGRR